MQNLESFKQHPKYEFLLISPEGVCINTHLNKRYEGDPETREYVKIPIVHNDILMGRNISTRTQLNRLVAETFIPIPTALRFHNVEDLVVNHIDHDPSNNRVENLEWLSMTGNANAAVQAGTKEAKKVYVRDLETGNISMYQSLGLCANAFHTSKGQILYYLKNGKNKAFKKRWEFTDDPNSFGDINKVKIVQSSATREIVAKDKDTGKLIIFPSSASCARDLKLKSRPSTITDKTLKAGEEGVDFGKYRLWTKEDFTCKVIREGKEKELDEATVVRTKGTFIHQKLPIPILVTDLDTGESKRWDSSEAYASSQGVMKKTFQRHVWAHNGIWRKKWKVEYLKDEVPKSRRSI